MKKTIIPLRWIIPLKNWKKAIIRTSIVIILIICINAFFVKVFRTVGKSMEPTIRNYSLVFVNRLAYLHHIPAEDDIIVFRTSNRPYLYFVKRVIGLPGETISFKDGSLYINGIEKSQPYISFKDNWTVKPFKVKKGFIFVAGDNRHFSWNEQFHAQVNIKDVIGKVIGYR
ncbi:MAG: signal peptidase I [Candidatus Omnitrophica bacterium]|nr:signal peptidase I [Candidatus Omnitrophota bacterium]